MPFQVRTSFPVKPMIRKYRQIGWTLYEHAITLDREIQCIWTRNRKTSAATILFLSGRYLQLALAFVLIILNCEQTLIVSRQLYGYVESLIHCLFPLRGPCFISVGTVNFFSILKSSASCLILERIFEALIVAICLTGSCTS